MIATQDSFWWLLFGSFFRTWWVVITGVASLLSWIYVPNGIAFGREAFATIILIFFMLVFFVLSTMYQGWRLNKSNLKLSTVVGFQRSDSYGGEFVFIIRGLHLIGKGKMAELKRPVHGVEVSFAIVELIDLNSRGDFQANPVWISPSHLLELRTGRFAISEVVVDPLITYRTLQRARLGTTT